MEILRHPESTFGFSNNGIIDVANDMTRSSNMQTLFNVHSRPLTSAISISGLVGNQINDYKSTVDASVGRDFLERLRSVNNTHFRSSATGSRSAAHRFRPAVVIPRYLYLNFDGRND